MYNFVNNEEKKDLIPIVIISLEMSKVSLVLLVIYSMRFLVSYYVSTMPHLIHVVPFCSKYF